MSLRPQQPLPPVPNDTARIARAAFRRGNPYVLLRDRLGTVFDDVGFADLYPAECTQSDASVQPSLRAGKRRANSNSFFICSAHSRNSSAA